MKNTLIIISIFISIIFVVFFSIEFYCRRQSKSLIEIIHPDWFEDVNRFPYDSFKCVKNCNIYNILVKRGYKKMSETNIVIAGLCINIESKIESLKKRLEYFGSFFKNYKVVIFENDSKDNTRNMLLDWSKQNTNIHIVSCPEDKDCKLKNKPATSYGMLSDKRMEKMADYRNRILSYIKNNFSSYDCVSMIDFDIGGPINIDGVANSFGLYENWDTISANGLMGATHSLGSLIYYDTLAYEDDSYGNWKNKFNIKFISEHFLIARNLAKKSIGEFPIRVKSGFAGLALYKMDVLNSGVNYTPENLIYKCEHKIFHDNMRNKGFSRIFINPNMIVLVGVQGQATESYVPLH